jgi:hypothetical protein
MSIVDVKTSIRLVIERKFGQRYTMTYDNSPPPVLAENVSPYPRIRAAIRLGSNNQADIRPDAARSRRSGVVLFSLFQKAEEGDGTLDALADEVEKAFRRTTIDGIVFRTPYTNTIGRVGSEWQVNVTCPFYTDTIE